MLKLTIVVREEQQYKIINMCLYPKLIKNRKFINNKKNGGNIPPLPLLYDKVNDKIIKDERVLLVPVGCGKCYECKKKKSREWQVRLNEEIRDNNNAKFITLTFSDESLYQLTNGLDINNKKICEPINLEGYNLENECATVGVRRFLERWRKKYKKSVKHWFITELGGNSTERIHLHGLIWTNELEDISKIWQYGIITIGNSKFNNGIRLDNKSLGFVNEQTINYIIKYVNKLDKLHPNYNSKILTSNGIGKNYINRIDASNNKFNGKNTNETYKTKKGLKIALPIYYRNKLYNEKEKEELWLNKLDEEIRYIWGEKIDISNGDDNYYKALEFYRNKNKRLGYGNDDKNWEKIRYENNRRYINKLTKLKNKKPPTS